MGKMKKSKSRPLTFDSEFPNLNVLGKNFQMDQFQRLLYNGGMVDDSGKKGIKYGDIGLIYGRAQKNKVKRLEARAAKRKVKFTKSAVSPEKQFIGRSEVEVLFEELQEVAGVQALFATPMLMAIHLAKKAKEAEQRAREAEEQFNG